MVRMSAAQRDEWMHGTKRQSTAIQVRVRQGDFQCDGCEDAAIAISHTGVGSPVRAECQAHFLASLNAERASRPSLETLLANVAR